MLERIGRPAAHLPGLKFGGQAGGEPLLTPATEDQGLALLLGSNGGTVVADGAVVFGSGLAYDASVVRVAPITANHRQHLLSNRVRRGRRPSNPFKFRLMRLFNLGGENE